MRSRIDIRTLSHEQHEFHRYVVSLRNKHVSHSVNGFEASAFSVQISIDSGGSVVRGGIAKNMQKVLSLSRAQLHQMHDLLRTLIAWADDESRLLSQAVKKYFSLLSDQDLISLPDLFDKFTTSDDVNRRRISS